MFVQLIGLRVRDFRHPQTRVMVVSESAAHSGAEELKADKHAIYSLLLAEKMLKSQVGLPDIANVRICVQSMRECENRVFEF